jgi:aromatic-amino-acid transaminase
MHCTRLFPLLSNNIMFNHIEAYAGDPILSLNETFQADPRPDKVNLSIGIYLDEQGRLPALDVIHQAELQMAKINKAKPYLPMEGAASFRTAVQHLLFGSDHEAVLGARIATIQTVGSSGGLRVGAEFIKTWFPESEVWVSDPTWDNHRSIFQSSGLKVNSYPYYQADGGVDVEGMKAKLATLPAGSVVLLHACCHNPTGADLTDEQWVDVIRVMKDRQLLPYLDLAYQGFSKGMDEDAFAVREMASAGLNMLVANSFSKSMGLYGERVGALSVVCPDAEQAALVLGQMKAIIRRNYSSPPQHGALIAALVMADPGLRKQWEADVKAMRERILSVRTLLHDALAALLPSKDFSYLLKQHGMFSYTGFSKQQVDALRDSHGIYLVGSGRVCVTGLNPDNIQRVANAFAAVMQQ